MWCVVCGGGFVCGVVWCVVVCGGVVREVVVVVDVVVVGLVLMKCSART